MGRKAIPDRWLDYRPVNDIIHHARIVPIKVPLQDHVFQRYDIHEYKWTPSDLMQRFPNIGLIIDVTNKFPAYYNIQEFTNKGIEYRKVACVGHFVPSEEVYQKFLAIIEEFLAYNQMNDRIIAVHCTHGINRTGFLLCRYLMERYNYSPEDAIETFARCRGYSIERNYYKEALYGLLSRRP